MTEYIVKDRAMVCRVFDLCYGAMEDDLAPLDWSDEGSVLLQTGALPDGRKVMFSFSPMTEEEIASDEDDVWKAHLRTVTVPENPRVEDEARALYDGGWRSADREDMLIEFNGADTEGFLLPEECDIICSVMKALEEREAAL